MPATFDSAWRDMSKQAGLGFAQFLDDFVSMMNFKGGLLAGGALDVIQAGQLAKCVSSAEDVSLCQAKTQKGGAAGIAAGALGRYALSAISLGIKSGITGETVHTVDYIRAGIDAQTRSPSANADKRFASANEGQAQYMNLVFGDTFNPAAWKKVLKFGGMSYDYAIKSYRTQRRTKEKLRYARRSVMAELEDAPIPSFAKDMIEGRLRAGEMDIMNQMNLQRLAADVTPILGAFAGGGPAGLGFIKGITDHIAAGKQRHKMRRRRARTMVKFQKNFEASIGGSDQLRAAINTYKNNEPSMTNEQRIQGLRNLKRYVPTDNSIYEVMPFLLPNEQNLILALDMLIDLYSKHGDKI